MPPQSTQGGSSSPAITRAWTTSRVGRHVAGQAAHAVGVAVQLDDALGIVAGPEVEPVDVLGHHAQQLAAPLQLDQRQVGRVRLGGGDDRIGLEAAPPGLASGLGARQEVGVLDRRVPIPDAAGAAEVRDAGLGADAGPGERHDPPRAGDQLGERLPPSACL